ncbi:MAG: bifunctional 5,10-methylenetetrahydrofolate dehydrogenase/5,10-methenyltetrahydrofolate cyclohydrolase [Anaerolineae bacterium]|jgi:methylenetetrahydrofolate dehydrogenase (NADP+)/methenyltetrahydrofolate cyclohydrolase
MPTDGFIDDTIKPQLIEALGRQATNSILTQATLSYVSRDGTEDERYEAFLESILSDERVTETMSEEIIAERLKEWRLRFTVHKAQLAIQQEKGGVMPAQILDGRAMAKEVREEIVAEVAGFKERYGFAPTIAVVRAGSDPASVSYAKMIQKSFEGVGMNFVLHELPETASLEEIIDVIAMLNADGSIHGIMVQEPLPKGIDEDEIKATIRADKDADGVNPINAGRLAQAPPVGSEPVEQDYLVPATPLGGLEMLKRSGVEMSGKQAVVVGRSNIVGRPMSFLLMQHHATVSMCHSRTRPLGNVTRQADILCTAVGIPNLIKADMVKPGAVVIDFGFNRLGDKWVGDVDFDEVKEVASMITPVPGGTGSMTNVMLMRNVLEAANKQMKKRGR